jgi:hypothetical protein
MTTQNLMPPVPTGRDSLSPELVTSIVNGHKYSAHIGQAVAVLVADAAALITLGWTSPSHGTHTMLSAADTIVTGLANVASAVASLESAPTLTCDRVQAVVGDQAGAPAAGSIILKAFMPTSSSVTTPIAATGWSGMVVNWIARGI